MIVSAVRAPSTPAELLPPELAGRLDALDVLSRKILSGKLQGERRSKRRGRSVEFDDYREYSAGDDLRHIDWNVFARLDRFFIKIFQEEEDLALHLLLDASASMMAGRPPKLFTAAQLAAALGYIGLVNNNRVTLTIFGGGAGVRRLEPLRGRRNLQRLVGFVLEHAFGEPPTPGRSEPAFTSTLKALAASPSGRGGAVVLSDLLTPGPDGYQAGLRALAAAGGGAAAGRAGGLDVHVLQILSAGELDPAAEAGGAGGAAGGPSPVIGDLRLTDAESGRTAEVTVSRALLERYRKVAAAYVAEAEAFCRARGMSHRLVRSDADVAGLVVDSLRRQGLLT